MSRKHTTQTSVPGNDHERYVLRLYVTGASPHSTRAIENIKSICSLHLANRYLLEIIDVYQQPEVASKVQLVALPLLVKVSPGPERKMIGDLSDTSKVLKILEVSL